MGKATKLSATQPLSPFRPPVVAVLGHVDHGKTTLLDAIRKTDIATHEHGGITQAIGAYQVMVVTKEGQHYITFIDTPGHEAFAKMRGRGVNAADVAVLVVACDDGVMPQTRESIAHIQEAKIPYIVALTKSDLTAANPERVKQQLTKEGIALEGQGGDVPVVTVSAKTDKGLLDLLETIVLVAQMAGVSGDPKGIFEGVVIEAKRDRRKGVLATVIIRNGTLLVGDEIYAESIRGKVRALLTEGGASIKEELPGSAVEILGFDDVPPVGAKVDKVSSHKMPTGVTGSTPTRVLEESARAEMQPKTPQLPVILKTDTEGSREAILHGMPRQGVKLILSATGDPTEGDVLLAKASNAIIVGFHVNISSSIAKHAETEGVVIKTYRLIYDLLKELSDVILLFQEGKPQEVIVGKAKIVAIFPYEKKKIAGCQVLEGRIAKGDKVRIEQEGNVIGESRIISLRRGKEDISKAEIGSECGILLSASLDFEPGNMILSVR